MEVYKEVGEVTIYGRWDDVIDNQFAVIWGEAGDDCTVLLFSGCDYGGGITNAGRADWKKVRDIIESSDDAYLIKKALAELLESV